MMTFAESESLFRLAVGGLVQLMLVWPFLPHRKQIGAGRPLPFPFDPDEGVGLGPLEPLPFEPFPLPPPFALGFDFALGLACGCLPKRGCRPESAGTTTG